MESTNRRYVDPATEPGDTGTEPWADDQADSETGDRTKPGPPVDPVASSEGAVAIDGSPADQFMTEDAVRARNEDPEEPASH